VLVALLIVFGVIALTAFMSSALKPKPSQDAVDARLLLTLEERVRRELSAEQKSELYRQLSRVNDIASQAAQERGLSMAEFDRLYRKGALQAYFTALQMANDPAFLTGQAASK